ncbi:2-hydroxyacid dehydrogenase [Halobellus salinisoli]|uniref:2-hydroxyacid dehydrogenase n=1 Tax=Halobellus salinisoli TaxID=3108500 RepID=UPI00300AA646
MPKNEAVVYITRKIPDPGIEILESVADVYVNDCGPQNPPSKTEIIEDVTELEADGLLCMLPDEIDRDVLTASPDLEVVSTLSVGFDHIDLEAANDYGIAVGHTPGVLSETCADLVWALVLATARRIVEGYRFVTDGEWKTWAPEAIVGQDVYGSTLGIIGLGKIGTAVAKRGAGFDIDVCYTARSRKPEREAELEELGVEVTHVSLDELLRRSDLVSVNVPLTDETEGLLGRREFQQMDDDALLVNTSRGEVIQTDALYEALAADEISRVCLDVTDPEPLPPTHRLLEFAPDRLIVTPHIGSSSVPTRNKMAEMAAENIVARFRDEQLPNAVVSPPNPGV